MNRLQRYGLIIFVLYFVFVGGSPYFGIPAVRYLHHMIMTALLGGWLGWRLWHGRGIPASPLNTPLLLFVLLAAISVLFSLDPRVSLEYLWFVLISVLSYWFIVNMFQNGKANLVYEILFLGAFLVVFLSILQVASALWGWGLHGNTAGWLNFIGEKIAFPVERDLRIFLPVGVSTWVSGISASLCVLAVAWALSRKAPVVRWIFWNLTALLAAVTLLTFSRGGWLSLGVSLSLLIVLRVFREKARFNRKTIYLSAGFAAVVILVGLLIFSSGIFSRRQSGDAIRLNLWSSAVSLIQDDPMTGVGIGQFGRGYRLYRMSAIADDRMATAHNLYLNVITETGIWMALVMLLALGTLVRSWWRLRTEYRHDSPERIIVDGFAAALAGFLLQNFFDTMTFTFAILLAGVMAVAVTIKPSRSPAKPATLPERMVAGLALIVVLLYGAWFVVIVDPAQRAFQESLNDGEQALASARAAESLDPALHLYDLQIAYLLGWQAYNDPTVENLQNAIASYTAALQLEPTWDTGWMNLAVLHELNGDLPAAFDAFDRASLINLRTPASIHRARIAEALGTIASEEIVESYRRGLLAMSVSRLPLSDFWTETALRREAVRQFLQEMPVDVQYRVLRVLEPEQAAELIPDDPQTVNDFWVVGEVAFSSGDMNTAYEAFSRAIALVPRGDYFASRARTMIGVDPLRAERDLEIARFLGTALEFPDAIELKSATSADRIQQLRIGAVPLPVISQSFEGVLYLARVAVFRLLPEAAFTSYGTTIMQPWYDLAMEHERSGELEQAIQTYEFIRLFAHDESAAQEALARLQP